MRKLFIVTQVLLSITVCSAQHIGIGTPTPSQPLDVNGNINTTGNLMVNGVAGTNGQVLTMNGNSMQWMDKSRFRNWAIYTAGVPTFTVPANTTEVMIEMWGAGGGGHNPGGGGGSGGYWIGLVPVTPGSSININVGSGGVGGVAATAGAPGGTTGFTCPGFNITTGGGEGADTTLAGSTRSYISGAGGAATTTLVAPAGYRNFFSVRGNCGNPTQITTMQNGSTLFEDFVMIGTGGVAPFSGLHPTPSTYNTKIASGEQLRSVFGSNTSTHFGCGGSPRGFAGGSTAINGGPGQLIIYY